MSVRAQFLCPRCPQVSLRRVGTREGMLGHCTGCRGHWLTREASRQLTPFLEQAVSRFPDAGRSGYCAQGLHPLAVGQEHCGVCPPPSLRCPGCAARLLPVALGAQTVGVCVRCPGMWLDANALSALKASLPPSTPKGPQPRLSRGEGWARLDDAVDNAVLSWNLFEFLDSLFD